MARFVIVPQWQGSPSSRAMMLVDGAQAIAGDLPRAACTPIDVPLEAGESLDTGVRRFSALTRTRSELSSLLAGYRENVVVVGGDCSVSVAAIGAAAEREPDLAVVWLDGHPDLHTPASSPSGAFSGMALAAVLGEGPAELALPAGVVSPARTILAGARDIEPAEEERARSLAAVLTADEIATRLTESIAATGAAGAYLHIDLDVLDPSALTGVTAPLPFGIDVATLVDAVRAVRESTPLVGATIAGFAPSSPAAAVDDLGAILRIVGALA